MLPSVDDFIVSNETFYVRSNSCEAPTRGILRMGGHKDKTIHRMVMMMVVRGSGRKVKTRMMMMIMRSRNPRY